MKLPFRARQAHLLLVLVASCSPMRRRSGDGSQGAVVEEDDSRVVELDGGVRLQPPGPTVDLASAEAREPEGKSDGMRELGLRVPAARH